MLSITQKERERNIEDLQPQIVLKNKKEKSFSSKRHGKACRLEYANNPFRSVKYDIARYKYKI